MSQAKGKNLSYSEILNLAKSVLYKHLRALGKLPSTDERIKGKPMPKGCLSGPQAEFVRKAINDLWKIEQVAGASGRDGSGLSARSTTDLATHLGKLLDEQGEQHTRRADKRAQA